jgi:sRNA-binding protein
MSTALTQQMELETFKGLFKQATGISLDSQTPGELVRELIGCAKTSLATKAKLREEQAEAARRQKDENPDLAGTGDDSATLQFAIADDKPRSETRIPEQPFAVGNISPGLAKKIVDRQEANGNLGATNNPPEKK